MSHQAFLELAAGAALEDLDATEQSALDDHLPTCGSCRIAAWELVDTTGLLALAAPQRRPPASLLGEIRAALAVPAITPAQAAPAAPALAILAPDAPVPAPERPIDTPTGAASAAPVDLGAVRRERDRYRRLSIAGLAAAAVLAIAVGALGVTAGSLRSDLAATTAERNAAVARLATTDEAMAVVLAPDHATASLAPDPPAAGAAVYVVYRPGTSEAWMMAANLPATPAGSVYQLWAADATGAHPLTTFTCDGKSACMAPFRVDLATADAAMITVEPDGGTQGEPGPQVAFGTLRG